MKSQIFFSIFLVSLECSLGTESTKPHIITILIDDLGWNDVGFHGSNQISTPNIDALAYSGIILNRHYVLPACTPSRAALLTGAYPIRTGMHGYPMKCGTRRGIPLSTKLKPQYLKHLGYRTHLVGKWHLGYSTPEYVPNSRGFDTFFGYYNGYIEYFKYGIGQGFTVNNSTRKYYGYDLHLNDEADWRWNGKYATTVFTDRARKIIEGHEKSEPLYLLLSHLGVHTGSEEGTGLEVPQDVNVDELYPHIRNRPRRELAGLLEEVDKSVGVIVKALYEKDMLKNSILLFMSDNGGHTVSIDMQPNWSSNWPLRGTKFTLYEGGVRSAAFIWSPLLPKGYVSEQFLHISDWLPTLYYAAGGNVSSIEKPDGLNQWNNLKEMNLAKRNHILLNIDEVEGDEGIILKNRWKVRKGGLRQYGHYDRHWGKEENVSPPPSGYYSKVRWSTAGQIISNLPKYGDALATKQVKLLRRDSRVRCTFDDDTEEANMNSSGFVDMSTDFFCSDYCVFDIVKDPCELNKVENDKVLSKGVKLLNKYRKLLRPQEDNSVDPLSDPRKFGGVWMPWLSNKKLFFF